jgi:hypothetical protein
VRGTAIKNGVRSEMPARISFPKYGKPRPIFRGKDKIFTEMNTIQFHLPKILEATLSGGKVESANHSRKQFQAKN